jgi:hypothetical protein
LHYILQGARGTGGGVDVSGSLHIVSSTRGLFMTKSSLTVYAILFSCLVASSAQAQVSRTFVSGTGSDNNPCTYASPCRFFTAAISALPAGGGEVDVLDPGSYGQVTITKPVSIIGRGWTTITATSTTAAIAIATTSGAVSISGIQLDGGGNGETGISFTGSGSLSVLDSVIRNFGGNGINIAPAADSQANVTLRNVVLLNNAGSGLNLNSANTTTINLIAENVTSNSNGTGVYADSLGFVVALFDHLVASQNTGHGIWMVGNQWLGTIKHSLIEGNMEADLLSNTGGSTELNDHNQIGSVAVTSGQVDSDGSNNIGTGGSSLTLLGTQ